MDKTFGQALEALKAGQKVARAGWNGKGLWLELYTPSTNNQCYMTLPYIFMAYPSTPAMKRRQHEQDHRAVFFY